MKPNNYTFQELRTIAKEVMGKEGLSIPEIQFKDTRCGRARYFTHKITMPLWVMKKKKEYTLYYLLHELTHFICQANSVFESHGGEFKLKETELLKEYNIIPVYAKAYVKELRDIKGNKICNGLGK